MAPIVAAARLAHAAREPAPAPGETVRALSWQLLADRFAPRLGGRWPALVEKAGGPEVDRHHPFDNVPLEAYVRCLDALDETLSARDGSILREAGEATAEAWAAKNRGLVRALRGNPAGILRVFATEAHPFLLDSTTAGEVIFDAPGSLDMALDNGLPEAYNLGLLQGFVGLARIPTAVATTGSGYHISWTPTGMARPVVAQLLLAIRAPLLVGSVVPIILGTAIAASQGSFDPAIFVLALVGGLLIHAGTNTANDFFDHRSGADRLDAGGGRRTSGSRAIQRHIVTPGAMGRLSAALFASGAAIGIVLAAMRGFDLLWLGVAGILLAVLYTMPPVALASRGLGEIAVGSGFGPIMVLGACFVQTAAFSWEAFVASIPFAALVAASHSVNEFPDYEADRGVGKRNLVVRLGPDRARILFYGLLATGLVAIPAGVLLGLLPSFTLIALAGLPLAWHAHKVFTVNYRDPHKLAPATTSTRLLHIVVGLLMAAAFLITGAPA